MKSNQSIKDIFYPAKTASGSFLVSFEGIEGSGKSTQIQNFTKLVESQGFNVTYFREPGGSKFGEQLRSAILNSQVPLHPYAEALLFASARSQLLFEKVQPELQKENTVVVLDRYIDSSIAYQGFARKLGLETILELHSHEPLVQMPHMTFLLRIDYQTSLARQSARGDEKDYFEKEHETFYQALIDGYDQSAKTFPERFCVVDATGDIESVQKQVAAFWNKRKS